MKKKFWRHHFICPLQVNYVKYHLYLSQNVLNIGKRIFLGYMRFSPRRTHAQTLTWAREAVNEQLDNVMGITGESVFFEAQDFDVVQDMLPEPMHLIDCGFMKNTCGRTFNSGATHQTDAGYRRCPTGELSDKVK